MLLKAVRDLRQTWDRSALLGRSRVGVGSHLDGRPFVDNRGRLEIGRNFKLSSRPVQSHLVVGPGARLDIGDDVSIGYGAAVSANVEVCIGEGVEIGPFAMILDSDFHLVGDHAAAGRADPIVIGRGTRIGSRVTVLRGARIGEGGVVVAGSVVADVVAPGSRVAGVPARPVGTSFDPQKAQEPRTLPEVVQGLVGNALDLAALPALDRGPAQLAQWDSLATLKIILALEEHFRVTLDERDIQEVENVGDLVAVVGRALNRR
jgi:maltose O-acetyltransferase